MSIIGWLILGLISGFIASKIVNKSGEGVILDIVLGIVGALVGGFLFSLVGAAPVTGFNLYSMFVAVIGAIVVLVLYHAVVGRGQSVRYPMSGLIHQIARLCMKAAGIENATHSPMRDPTGNGTIENRRWSADRHAKGRSPARRGFAAVSTILVIVSISA
jgi:uncharacterized membrane protein YeaQ/YmgE (transglycosylase-associated protein family)